MLSQRHVRQPRSVRQAYVCLHCRLNAPRRDFTSTSVNRAAKDPPIISRDGRVSFYFASASDEPGAQNRRDARNRRYEFPRNARKSSKPDLVQGELPLPQPHLVQGEFRSPQANSASDSRWRFRPEHNDDSLAEVPRFRKISHADVTKGGHFLTSRLGSEDPFEVAPRAVIGESRARSAASRGRASSRERSASNATGKFKDLLWSHTSRPRHANEHLEATMGQTLGTRHVLDAFGPASSPPRITYQAMDSPLQRGATFKRLVLKAVPTKRAYHVTSRQRQSHEASLSASNQLPPDVPAPFQAQSSIRGKLRRWQEEHGQHLEMTLKEMHNIREEANDESTNSLTRLGDAKDIRNMSDQREHEREAIAHFTGAQAQDLEDDTTDPRFLFTGDLVELEFPTSEKESLLAVFVRRLGPESQCYTMQGRWVHVPERNIQYSIPGWVSPELVEPLIEFLPNDEQIMDMESLRRDAYVNDLSVPRHLAAPLVSRMVAFSRESQEIYRKHASTLDRAHEILAHDSDLRYGSLVSAASKLLDTPADKLPLTALFTVRKALMHAGFAFNVDRRSHRMTGYIQIRSKQQVEMVEQVRTWLREWQDDLATTATMTSRQKERHRPNRGATIVQRFLAQAREIVWASRKNRDPTVYGNIGPSKKKRELTQDQQSVHIETDTRFNANDQELVRFVESWACMNMFLGLPRINALPPLLLQATGLYEEYALDKKTGYVFLQELGTILPYENRVRFDQHLLLPSSQHSKPLQVLMDNLMRMADKPNFSDSMAELRHDWGQLPVYCIDAASALEIDDGLSVERANPGSDKPEWWVHAHIANPTAFFDRDHPLAKMARHMGETIYTPERSYMMLPRWATQRHFSLKAHRPCLTFSARLNEQGEVLEHKIRPGFVRNVIRLTPDETTHLVGLTPIHEQPEIDITVGGNPPPEKPRTSAVPSMTESNLEDLKIMQKLAEGRQKVRKSGGGVFFDSARPELKVWQAWSLNGLAWDHPHRKGARHVEGDPIINMKTRGLTNWFAAGDGVADILVREMMLLACEVSTAWCAERNIPTIYRGSVAKPNAPDPQEYYDANCLPAIQKNNGVMPMHVGIEYIRNMGSVILSTKPLPHKLLGLSTYGKVTSPLRRYGDMILHWQIEAALRQEASSGKSLITSGASFSGRQPDRSFLPFNTNSLQALMTGLQPRESVITRAKSYADSFWVSMLAFRAHHFGEAKLPFETCHGYFWTDPSKLLTLMVICEELNVVCTIQDPAKHGLGEARAGDRWECVVEEVHVFERNIILKPLRLAYRYE